MALIGLSTFLILALVMLRGEVNESFCQTLFARFVDELCVCCITQGRILSVLRD